MQPCLNATLNPPLGAEMKSKKINEHHIMVIWSNRGLTRSLMGRSRWF
jgi:hypothetical protein